MFDNHVKKGEPVWLSEKEEIIVTETISEIVEKDRLNIVAYNICGDHAHIVLACTEEELPKIMQKIKAMSARACNIAMGRTIPGEHEGAREPATAHAPHTESVTDAGTREHASAQLATYPEKNGEHAPRGKTQFHLWAEKFDGKEITSNEQLENTMAYINNNRKKHNLPENKKLQSLIQNMISSRKHAFRTEYTGGFD
ncbi:MAG: transposase, partial [Bacteroidales bacterium]|nr:transposase [Bacteroidales bacterium]